MVGARRLLLPADGLGEGVALWVRVDHLRGETGFDVCDCALGAGAPPAKQAQARERALASGRLTAFVAEGASATP